MKGPQNYIPVDAALPPMVNFGPGERAEMVRKSVAVCDKKGALGSGYIPKTYQTTCSANSAGLFAYYQYAEAGMILTCRTPDGSGSGWAGITGVKDLSLIDPVHISEIAADKAVKSQKPRALEPGRYTVILESRPAARFLSLMTGIFNARQVETGPRSLSDRHREGHVEARTEGLQRSRHDQERHRQPDPAPDADPARRHAGEAGDLGRKGRAEEPLLRPAVRGAREEGSDAGDGRT